jgi:signal transduction histidine kinase
MVSVDPVKFRQVILNLLDNSIKYTQSGFVKLSIKKEIAGKGSKATSKAGNAVVSISDSGMGMSPETKTKLFGKFARGEGTKVNAGGSGIGLYLVKEIVEAHGGTVSADSPGLEKGSVFTVTLPLKAVEKV